MKYLLILLSLACTLFLSACVTSDNDVPANSIAGNGSIPGKPLANFFDNRVWMRINELPYDGYVILRGRVKDKKIVITQVIESYPDDSRNDMARALANNLQSSASPAGSHIQPSMDVFVVFYETPCDPNRALVFSERSSTAAPTVSVGGDNFIRLFSYKDSVFKELPEGEGLTEE